MVKAHSSPRSRCRCTTGSSLARADAELFKREATPGRGPACWAGQPLRADVALRQEPAASANAPVELAEQEIVGRDADHHDDRRAWPAAPATSVCSCRSSRWPSPVAAAVGDDELAGHQGLPREPPRLLQPGHRRRGMRRGQVTMRRYRTQPPARRASGPRASYNRRHLPDRLQGRQRHRREGARRSPRRRRLARSRRTTPRRGAPRRRTA